MKINKIETRNWLRGIGIATVSTLLISISVIANGQCTQCDVGFRDCASRCQLGAAHQLAGRRGLAGGGRGALAGARQNVALLAHRETPPGNMGLHFPYNATQMYYYRRPYNDFHVPMHLGESRDGPAQSTFGQGLGYSNQIFEQKDGLLEFVDWRDHRQERQIWESTPRYHSEYRDDSYPTINEEVMNVNPIDNPEYEKLSRSPSGFGPEHNFERTSKSKPTSTEDFRDSSFQRRVSSRPSGSSLNRRK